MHRGGRLVLFGVLLAGMVGCRKELVAPGECPASCPGGTPEVVDTLVFPATGQDSTYVGYTPAGGGVALLASDGFPDVDARAVVRFLPQPDSLKVADTTRAYTIDSVAFRIGILDRDTTVHGLQIHLYRLPIADADSGVTFAQIAPLLVPGNFIGSIAVDDTVASGAVRLVLTGADLALVDIPPADSGSLGLAAAITADAGTGVRLGSQSAGGLGPLFQVYARVDVADEDLQEQTIGRVAAFSTYVVQNPWTPDPQLLAVGGEPAARALLRFDLPAGLLSADSTQIIRATLELVPATPIIGLPFDTAVVRARGVVADLGAKSPLCALAAGNLCGPAFVTRIYSAQLMAGSTDTVRIEVDDLIRGMQGDRPAAQALFLEVDPEAATFTRVQFGSTAVPAMRPRLRVTFVRAFPFQAR